MWVWMLERTPPWGKVTPESNLLSSSSFLMNNWRCLGIILLLSLAALPANSSISAARYYSTATTPNSFYNFLADDGYDPRETVDQLGFPLDFLRFPRRDIWLFNWGHGGLAASCHVRTFVVVNFATSTSISEISLIHHFVPQSIWARLPRPDICLLDGGLAASCTFESSL